jgi:hypothetical protein
LAKVARDHYDRAVGGIALRVRVKAMLPLRPVVALE